MEYDFMMVFGYWKAFLQGLLMTLKVTGVCVVFGLLLGFVLSLMRTSSNKVIWAISTVYVEFFRCTPVLVQLFWFFFCLPLILNMEIGNFMSGVIALTLYMAAIASETFRSSLKSISTDQIDACTALGLSYSIKIIHVIMPQAFIRAIPTLLSNTVSLFKESALVSAVGMADLMFISQNISNTTARPVEVLTTTAFIYFIIAFPITRAVTRVESRLLLKFNE